MITENKRVRFCENNYVDANSILDFSSEMTDFPFSNSYTDERSKVWKPSGYFKITSSNNKIYFNDGLSDQEVTITIGEYATPQLLASEIQTRLNDVMVGFTVSYGANFKFVISNTSEVTLKLSITTNSIAETLGYTSQVDSFAYTFYADVISVHTSEWATFDLGYEASVDFVAMVGNVDEIFTLSSTAQVVLYGNNVLDFDTPAFTKQLTRFDGGIMNFIDDADSSYRYWKIEIIDPTNVNGNQCFSISNLYLGDYQTLQSRNLENGFTVSFEDKSKTYEAESGSKFFDKKAKFKKFDGMSLGFLDKTDKKMFDTMFQKLGISTPFYISIDPTGCFTDELDELTKLARFSSSPSYQHIIRDIFSIKISIEECV